MCAKKKKKYKKRKEMSGQCEKGEKTSNVKCLLIVHAHTCTAYCVCLCVCVCVKMNENDLQVAIEACAKGVVVQLTHIYSYTHTHTYCRATNLAYTTQHATQANTRKHSNNTRAMQTSWKGSSWKCWGSMEQSMNSPSYRFQHLSLVCVRNW